MAKNLFFTVLLFLTVTIDLQSQSIEIIPQANYTFGGRIYGKFGEMKIANSESYGTSFNIVTPANVSFQIEYFYQPTVGEYRDYFDPGQFNQNADLRVNWIQVGVRKRFEVQEKIVPFGGLSVGLTNFDLRSSPTSYNEWALSLALQGGVNVYLSKLIGLRFHARLLTPIQFTGFGFYAGTGGAAVGATAGSYFVQADLGTGLIIRLSQE